MPDPALKDAAAVGEWIIEAKRRRRDEGYFQFLCVATHTHGTTSGMSLSGKESMAMKSVQGAIVKETKRMHNTNGVQNAHGPVNAERTNCLPSGAGRIECIMMMIMIMRCRKTWLHVQ